MTSPSGLTVAQQQSLDHANQAIALAAPCEDDALLEPSMRSVVNAYRALAHALLATWAAGMPDSAFN